MKTASETRGDPAMLCERCKTEIALANLLDAEPLSLTYARAHASGSNSRCRGRSWPLRHGRCAISCSEAG
jgi:hypothetical protein